MLKQVSTLKQDEITSFTPERLEWVGNCFMELVNLIIYERRELYQGWDQLQKYCSHKYDAYQHFLILKSCADLQKFDIEAIARLEQKFITSQDEKETLRWPKCMFILLTLCKALIQYAYYIYGYVPKPNQVLASPPKKAQLEEIQEGSEEEEDGAPAETVDLNA